MLFKLHHFTITYCICIRILSFHHAIAITDGFTAEFMHCPLHTCVTSSLFVRYLISFLATSLQFTYTTCIRNYLLALPCSPVFLEHTTSFTFLSDHYRFLNILTFTAQKLTIHPPHHAHHTHYIQVGHDTWMVNTADSGERAIQVLESSLKLPDVIVIDQNMSSSGGKLLGHEVRARSLVCVCCLRLNLWCIVQL